MQRFGWAVIAFLTVTGFPAQAQSVNECIDRCFSTFSPSQNNGSTELRSECLQSCNARPRSTILYGALAYDPDSGAWGEAHGMGSAGAAQESAMARCREHGPGCRLAASYSGTCAAVTVGRTLHRFATGQGPNLAQAKANAMNACNAQLGGDCVVGASSCASNTQ